MNVELVNERGTIPEYATENSACFDLKVCIENGQRLHSVNAFNKQMGVPVKGVSTVRDSFQLPPGIRCLIPTGLKIDVPKKHVMKIYINEEATLHKGLAIPSGVMIRDADSIGELHILVENVSDSMAIITHGDNIAIGLFEKSVRVTKK
jgi:dUTPase